MSGVQKEVDMDGDDEAKQLSLLDLMAAPKSEARPKSKKPCPKCFSYSIYKSGRELRCGSCGIIVGYTKTSSS